MGTPTGELERRRVIVTDDNTNKLFALTEILRKAGLCVFAAYDGQSALELIGQLPSIDLLITDTRLGVVDGFELMARTRNLRPGMPILHIIHDDAPAIESPPEDVTKLREPFTPERLLAAVRTLLR